MNGSAHGGITPEVGFRLLLEAEAGYPSFPSGGLPENDLAMLSSNFRSRSFGGRDMLYCVDK